MTVELAIGGPVALSLAAIRTSLATSQSRPPTHAPEWSAVAPRARGSLRRSVLPRHRAWLAAFDALRASVPADTIVVSDAAAIDSWTAFFWDAPAPGTFLFPWGSAALGFSLPAAIGASLAAPTSPVLAICGDGGFAFSAMELATAVQARARVVVVVADDAGYGSIAAYQLARYGRSYATDLPGPDLTTLAAAFSVPVRRIEGPEALPAAVCELVEAGGPGLVQLRGRVPSPW